MVGAGGAQGSNGGKEATMVEGRRDEALEMLVEVMEGQQLPQGIGRQKKEGSCEAGGWVGPVTCKSSNTDRAIVQNSHREDNRAFQANEMSVRISWCR